MFYEWHLFCQHASKTKSTARAVLLFLERCVPPQRNEMCPSGVMFASQVMCASRVSKEHITSLCDEGAKHHCERSELHHCDEVATSLKTSPSALEKHRKL